MNQLNLLEIMKTKSFLKKMFAAFIVIFFTLTVNQISAQSNKISKAENKFCTSVDNFVASLETLAEANEGSDIAAFDKAYNAAEKTWNKVVKGAEKLEEVEISEGVKAYNNLVDEINKIGDGTKAGENTDKISKHIETCLGTFDQITGPICD